MKRFFLFSICIVFTFAQSDWPQWRGQQFNAAVMENTLLQNDKSYTLKTLWKRNLGSGYSSISVWGNYAVTMYSDSKKDYVIACNAHSGENVWQYTIGDTYVGHDGSHDGPISTPVVDQEKVFALGAKGELLCLNLTDGSLLWKKNLPTEHKANVPFYGFGTSPIVSENLVIVQAGAEKGTISAFHKQNGELVWTMGSDSVNYQCPTMITMDNKNYLLCGGDKHLYCILPESGEEVWRYEHNGGNWSTMPTVVSKNPWQIYIQYSGNQGILLELTGEKDKPVKEVWKTRSLKKSFCPPVVVGERIYGYSGRFFGCINAKNGKKVWRSRQPGDGFLLVVNNHFVVVTKNGHLHLANDASGKYTDLHSLKLFKDLVWSPPSFAHNKIYVRSLGEMACISISDKASTEQNKSQIVYPKVESQFNDFVEKVRNSPNKKELIDAFMKEQKQFPIMEKNSIHFVYRGEAHDIGLEGDVIGFRIDHPMQRIPDTNFFYYSSYIEEDACVNYRFLKNYDEIVVDPLNKNIGQNYFGKFSAAKMPKWKPASDLEGSDKKGKLEKHTYESKENKDKREITVYVPHEYDAKKSYPVLFIHDGKSVLESGKWQDTLDYLISKGLPAAIAVFIPQKHGREYSLEAPRNQYIKMLVEEWIPFLEKTYSIKGSPRFNIGFVNGATVSLYATMQNPQVFSGAASVSAFYLTKEEQELSSLIAEIKEPLKFYISWGKYDLRSPNDGWSLIDSGKNVAAAIAKTNNHSISHVFPGGFSWENWRNENGKILKHFLGKGDKQ
ncbi:outer membrane protein assembly factor BamB family protein [Candidatus Uabimicrobium amorphum]|uniref:Alcohol dehydrogenase n=1 Tax=Uabimicrobium amorphum TaxID=2596890 RepID=A0A5S9IJH7_UABAM|nr:PQQ-binding-like beta-propeller repeat protein [Candidatus Uabimicrobium amorphum]BBM83029.1 alcohol dehydrogenase [Candidatus Uabimicrobium amorphum]